MTHEEVVEFVTGLGGTIAVVASEENGDPEMAWGDTFFFYDPDGITVPEKRMPFATIVVSDYAGFDEASDLSRPGVFRVNISVSRETFEQQSPPDAFFRLQRARPGDTPPGLRSPVLAECAQSGRPHRRHRQSLVHRSTPQGTDPIRQESDQMSGGEG